MNINKIALSTLIVSLGLLLGRISGFFRELLIANNFGANENSDFIVLLLTTPDFLVSLLMGGAMSMALIPEFKRLDLDKSRILYQQVSTCMMVFGFLLVMIAFIFSSDMIRYLALGMDKEFISHNESYFFYSLLALPFSLTTGASLAYLNSQERFSVTSLGTLIVNLTIVIFIGLAAYVGNGFFFVSVGLICASILRWLSQVASLRIFPLSIFSPNSSLISKELLKRYIYALFSGGIVFSLPVVVRTIASIEGAGALSLVNYTTKLVELPLIILSTAFSIVLLPILSKVYTEGNEDKFSNVSSLVCFLVFFMSLLILIPLNIHTSLATEVVYGWGKLSNIQLDRISYYLSIYSLSLPFLCINGILLSIFSARRDTKTPFLVTTTLGVVFFTYLLLVRPSIVALLQSLVVFYFLMTFLLVLFLRLKHKFWIMHVEFKLVTIFFSMLLGVYLCVRLTKDTLLNLQPVFSAFILGLFIICILMVTLMMFKVRIKNDN